MLPHSLILPLKLIQYALHLSSVTNAALENTETILTTRLFENTHVAVIRDPVSLAK